MAMPKLKLSFFDFFSKKISGHWLSVLENDKTNKIYKKIRDRFWPPCFRLRFQARGQSPQLGERMTRL
jgi:hypothetical protein